MLSRKDPDRRGKALPTEWTDKVRDLLSSTYEGQCKVDQKEFFVYGEIMSDELLLSTTYALQDNKVNELPVTLHLSYELDDKSKPEEILDKLVDCMGIFFDEVFADSEWADYEAEWKEGEHKSLKFHYRASREDIRLTLEADRLLGRVDQ